MTSGCSRYPRTPDMERITAIRRAASSCASGAALRSSSSSLTATRSAPASGLDGRDDFDFNEEVLRQTRDFDGRARWRLTLKVSAVDLVDLREVAHVLQEDGRLDDVFEF